FDSCKNLAEFKGKFASEDGRCLIVNGVLKSFASAGITTYNIPDGVTQIGDYAFEYCSGLTSITIPNSVTEIEDCAFSYCSRLASITIPGSVTEIGFESFWYCSGLTSITIPDSVTKIGGYAFCRCDSLTSITIPNSVTVIGYYAFQNCSNLTSVFCERTTPPTANFEGYSSWDAFDYNAADRKIYVPAESVDAYKEADGWKEYADAIEPYDFSAVSE
ncbi:MAG: leucine-rich repeat domain-containing protein, partial [Alistipes sp.]|nr:leucine-rich repeat domain-containing protein [Alistipes sp.]